jgi:hypothetical protein
VPTIDPVQGFLQAISELLAGGGVNVSPETVGLILSVLAAIVAVQLAISAAKTSYAAVKAVTRYTRTQIQAKFWRDSGKLATLISLVLLVLAYGLYDQQQPVALGEAVLRLGRERLLEILPIAILTQTVLLCAFWLIYGRIFQVPRATLADPFKSLLTFLAGMAVFSAGSIVIFLIIGDDPETALVILGATMMVGFVYVFALTRFLKGRQKPGGKPGPAIVLLAVVPVLMLLAVFGSLFAAVYTGISDAPTVSGLIGFIAIVLAVIMLIACYQFRAYIGEAEVPPATGYFIDFSLAVSALAVALISQPGAEIRLGGVPPWVVVVVPALLVAAAVFVFNLLRLRSSTPRWALALIVAIVAGLLVGPAKAVLTPMLRPVSDLVPVPGAIEP